MKVENRVIYSGFNDVRTRIVDHLFDQYGWKPVYFHGVESSKEEATRKYPDAIFQDRMALRQSKFDYMGLDPVVPVDIEMINKLSPYSFNCFTLMEDTTGWNFSFDQRRRFYYDMMKYWNTVIHHLKPDLVVFYTQPHNIDDYILYLLCRHCYNVPVLYINPVPFFDKHYHVICDSKEDISSPFMPFYLSHEAYVLDPEVKEYLHRLRESGGIVPAHIARLHQHKQDSQKFQYKEFLRWLALTVLGRQFSELGSALKCNRHPFESPKSRLKKYQLFWFNNSLRRRTRKLSKIYRSFSKEPDLNRKYLYFASSYQPEAVTSPNADAYEDQFLVLDMLSAAIPKDWVIYFKEHPGVFIPLLPRRGALSRDYYYYKKIASYPNVIMIPADSVDNTFQLIDGAQAVASVAGTVNWEAAVRGKPALFFGNVWYQGCESLLRVRSYQDCREAIAKIQEGFKPDQKDIERFCAAIQKASVKGMIHRDFFKSIKECSDPNKEMERVADAIHAAYERSYTGSFGLIDREVKMPV